ncbi:MAG: hypothetical protein N2578_09700, partial [Bdellovibrionaceae bacterium]|nr:hypothetical protein [Pseudobdellovibrionaceae bacterium]
MRKVVFSACLFWLVKAQLALAYAVDWSGRYRFEWTQLERPTLGTPGERKSYILHSLLLDGRLIASDGVNLVARFDVLSNPYSAYQHEQHGMIWGGGYAGPTPSNTVTSTVPTSGIRTTQLYLDVNTENAALLLGRAPYHFGMGMFFDAGRGPWDHWNNNRDLIAAKFIVNNVHFSPILSRWAQQDYGQGNVVQEEIFELVYDRKDTRVQLGLMTARRTASS